MYHHLYCLVTGNDDPDEVLQFRRKYLLFQCNLIYFIFFCKLSLSTKLSFSLVKFVWSQPHNFHTAFTGNSVLTYVTGLSTTYDVTSRMTYSIQEYFLINTTNITEQILKITSCSTQYNTIHILYNPSTKTLWFLYITPGMTIPPWCFSHDCDNKQPLFHPLQYQLTGPSNGKKKMFPMRYKLHLYIHNV
jgi:hypothetical protein